MFSEKNTALIGVPRQLWKAIPTKLDNLRVGWTVSYVKRKTGSGGYWIWRAPNGDRCRSIPEALKHPLAAPLDHCAIEVVGWSFLHTNSFLHTVCKKAFAA